MKKQITIILLLVCIITLFLAACSGGLKEPDAEDIRRDLANSRKTIIPEDQNISDVEIIDTFIDKEDKSVEFEVIAEADDGDAKYTYYIKLLYRTYDNKEWELSTVKPTSESKWTVTPLAGVKEDIIRNDLLNAFQYEQITIDNEIWRVTDENIRNVTIDSRNTQLAQKSDTVTVTLEIDDEVMIASGSLLVEYTFSDNGWEFVSYKNNTPFTASDKPETALELTDDDVFAEVLSMRLPFVPNKNSWNPTTQQIIDITENEVSNFKQDTIINEQKGIKREYQYSFEIDKGMVTFDALVSVKYSFERLNGWVRDDFAVDLSVTSVDFEGTRWEGEHILKPSGSYTSPEPKPMILEITDIASNGATYATLTFDFGDSTTIVQKFEGTFYEETLTFDLRFSEWVTTAMTYNGRRTGYEFSSNFTRRIDGYISVGDMSLQSNQRNSTSYHDFDLQFAPEELP